MDLRLLKKLISLLEQSQLSELSVTQEGFSISLKKTPSIKYHHPLPPPAAPAQAEQPSPAPGIAVPSPMVGTFYHASAPDKPPYVQVGHKVTQGQTIGIIEAMKMMNSIESPISGTVVDICVPNGMGVEFGQALIIVKQD